MPPCHAPLFEPRPGWECALRAVAIIVALPVLFLFSWIPAVHCMLLRLLFELRRCSKGNRESNLDLRFDPNAWIAELQLSSEIIWEEPQGELRPHSSWTRDERAELWSAFWKARLEEPMGIPDAPAEAAPAATGRAFGTAYSRDLAWRIFLAHVAHSLAVEHARRVPWSLRTATPAERAILFDSRAFFRPIRDLYEPLMNDHGWLTYGDPVATFRFARTIGASPAAIVQWAHENMIHIRGDLSPANCTNHFGYAGYPPVAAVIAGTTRTDDGRFAHWSAGCWGMNGFVRAVLRTANLGVAVRGVAGHALPHFVRDDVFLSHGDDPYNALTRTNPPYSMALLLVGAAQFDAWYGATVPPADAANNVGRRVVEVTVDHPESLYLLQARCRDIDGGVPRPSSEVYRVFRDHYTVAELEARTLWERIDAAIAARGGCRSL